MSGPSCLIVCARQSQWRAAGRVTLRAGVSSCQASSSSSSSYSTSVPAPQHQGQSARRRSNTSGFKPRTDSLSSRKILPKQVNTSSIRLDLSAQDVEQSWKAWLQVCENGKAGQISTEDIISLIKLIEMGTGVEVKLKRLSEFLLKGRILEPLPECMKAQLRAGQDEDLLATAVEVLSPWMAFEIDDSQDRSEISRIVASNAIVLSAIVCARKPIPDVLPLTRMVRPLLPRWIVSAGAYRKKLPSGSQSNGSVLTMNTALTILQTMCADAASAQLPLAFCRHAILAWGLDMKDPKHEGQEGAGMARRLFKLFNSGDCDTVKMFLETAMEAKEAKFGNWLTMSSQHDFNADWNDMTWHAVLKYSIVAGRTDLAEQAWSAYMSIKLSNEAPTPWVWNALLSGYLQNDNFKSMRSSWNQMKAFGVQPTIFAYTSMMTGFFRSSKPNEALLLYKDYKERIGKKELPWSAEIFTGLIHGLHINKKPEIATEIFQDLIRGRDGLPKPSISIINVFLKEYGRTADFVLTMETLRTMSDLGLKPDQYTFTTLMDSFTQAGIPGAVNHLFKLMLQESLYIDVVTMNTLLKNTLVTREDGTVVDFASALDILDKLETEGPAPDTQIYATIMNAVCNLGHDFEDLCKSGNLRLPYYDLVYRRTARPSFFAPNLRFALALLRRLKERGLKADGFTYRTLIAGLLNQGNINAVKDRQKVTLVHLDEAMKLLEVYLAAELGSEKKTWEVVMNHLIDWSRNSDPVVAAESRKHLSTTIDRIKKLRDGRIHALVELQLEEAASLLSRH